MSYARTRNELDRLVGDLPGPGRSSRPRPTGSSCAAGPGSLKRHGNGPCRRRLALVRRLGSVELDLVKARFAGPVVVIELDMSFGSVEIRLPDGASASIDDVEVYGGSASDRRKARRPRARRMWC